MEVWKKNLFLCCLSCFIVSIGMSQLAPMLPLYLAELGVDGEGEIARWSGLIFGVNFVSLAVAAPIWGRLSDRFGRKPMVLRASFALGVIMVGMGLAASPEQLFALRLLQGTMSGFLGAAVPLVAQETPPERSGWALGLFFTSQVTGALIGPLAGGWLVEAYSCRMAFYIVGAWCFLGFFALFGIHETFQPKKEAAALPFREVWAQLADRRLIVGLFVTTFLLQFALNLVQPIVTVYIAALAPASEHVALTAGAVFAATGVASALAASPLGKLADRLGPRPVLLASLAVGGFSFLPQAFVRTPLELGLLRFLAGLAGGGLIPSLNSLIRRNTPDSVLGRIYGLNQSAQFVGMFSGSFLGGWLAGRFGIAAVFLFPGALLLLAALLLWAVSHRHA